MGVIDEVVGEMQTARSSIEIILTLASRGENFATPQATQIVFKSIVMREVELVAGLNLELLADIMDRRLASTTVQSVLVDFMAFHLEIKMTAECTETSFLHPFVDPLVKLFLSDCASNPFCILLLARFLLDF